MSTSITQTHINSLEAALVSGELQVRIGDRWITYRSVEEIQAALDYARRQMARAAAGESRPIAYTATLDRGV